MKEKEEKEKDLLNIMLGYSTVKYNTVQYSTVQYSTVQYSTVQYSTVQYSTVQYSTVQYSTVQQSMPQVTTLRAAISYISGLQSLLADCEAGLVDPTHFQVI